MTAPATTLAPPARGEEYVDTFGWDTVYAVRASDANRVIVDRRASPDRFVYQDDDTMVHCEGSFGDWQIREGGDGSNLHLALPVHGVAGWFHTDAGIHPFDYGELVATIQVKLRYLPQPGSRGADGPVPHQLTVRAESPVPNTDPVASLVDVQWCGGDVQPAIAKYLIEGAITGWCNANLAEFAHVFATVGINTRVDTGAWAFCKPTTTSYAYIDNGTLDSSVLGVLCMTGGRSPARNAQQLSQLAIPDGSRAGFVISRARLLSDLVLPTIPVSWQHASTSQFTVSSDDSTINLDARQRVRLDDVRHGGIDYTPYLTSFSFEVTGSEIRVDTRTEVDLGFGITGWCDSTHWFTITLGRNGKGEPTLVYEEVRAAVDTHGTYQNDVSDIVLAILGALATAILVVITDGTVLLVLGLIFGLVLGVVAATPAIIKEATGDYAPPIDLLAFNATAPVSWTGGAAFTLDQVVLNSSLQLGGDPGYG